ncbi:MAG: hypothetical protein KKC68_08290 [Candidatus Thermoplasmatota archaeon]|nr:hypothetical protein [Candidatus Thermoplasmatota archaeon]MBU1941758.1 hypothetical protein [Candidatus Thermoplasmatota archaeon]
MPNHIFVTAINCMDGRVQQPIIDWMKHTYQADYVDMITEPGPLKILTETPFHTAGESIKKRFEISVHKHDSRVAAIVGHHDCTGNPVDKKTQLTQIHTALKIINSWGYEITIIGLWVDDFWQVHQITE